MAIKAKNSIAVVIPLYNGAPWIEDTIKSILMQELMPYEIVVVDDGSTDNGSKIVKKHKEILLVRNEGKGSSMARNLGTRLTKSPLIAFLDQDDLWHSSHLRLLQDALLKNPEANSAISVAESFNITLPTYKNKKVELTYFDPWTRFPFTIGVDGPSLALIRRETLLDIGLWEEKSTGMGDALLFLKLSVIRPLLKLNACTVGKRVHAGSQWIKIRDWGEKYLNFRYQVMRSALDFRIKIVENDRLLSELEERLKALETLQFLTQAITGNKKEDIVIYAHILEEQLVNSSEELIPHIFYCLMGALFPIFDSEQLKNERDKVFIGLLEIWPGDAYRTKKAITKLIGEKPLVS